MATPAQRPPQKPVPVFPLPQVVLFPGIEMPLHVFELRYRTMVREALSGERVIALALLKPGWEADYHQSPEFHPLGCLARFEDVEWLPNDCYDLKVRGLTRVRFTRIVKEFPYRAARVELLPQHPYSEDDPLIEMEKADLAATYERLLKAAGDSRPVDREQPLEVLVNTICSTASASPEECLELLAIDSLIERAQRVRDSVEKRLKLGAVRAAMRARDREEPGELN